MSYFTKTRSTMPCVIFKRCMLKTNQIQFNIYTDDAEPPIHEIGIACSTVVPCIYVSE